MPTPFPKDKESTDSVVCGRRLELVWAATPRCGCCGCSAIASATAASRPWEGEKVWSRYCVGPDAVLDIRRRDGKIEGRRCASARWPVPMQAIAEGLADHKDLRKLSLGQNGFGDAGTQAWS